MTNGAERLLRFEEQPFDMAAYALAHEGRSVMLLSVGAEAEPASYADIHSTIASHLPGKYNFGAPWIQYDWLERHLVPSGLYVEGAGCYTPESSKVSQYLPLAAFMIEQGAADDRSVMSVFGKPDSRVGLKVNPQQARLKALRYVLDATASSRELTTADAIAATGVSSSVAIRNILRRLHDFDLLVFDDWTISDEPVVVAGPRMPEPLGGNAGDVAEFVVATVFEQGEISRQKLRGMALETTSLADVPEDEAFVRVKQVLARLKRSGRIAVRDCIQNDGLLRVNLVDGQADFLADMFEGLDKAVGADPEFVRQYNALAANYAHSPEVFRSAFDRLERDSRNIRRNSCKLPIKDVVVRLLSEREGQWMSIRAITELAGVLDLPDLGIPHRSQVRRGVGELEAIASIESEVRSNGKVYRLRPESQVA